jgi:hypothetical protein
VGTDARLIKSCISYVRASVGTSDCQYILYRIDLYWNSWSAINHLFMLATDITLPSTFICRKIPADKL